MKDRCTNLNCPKYKYYGAKGVNYQKSWEKFDNFLDDMGIRPDNTTLDRKDSNGDYTKENCRWVSKKVQAYNQKLREGNKSGKSGVFESKKSQKPSWLAFIRNNGKREHLGSFSSFELAVKAREAAEIRYYGELRGN